MNKEELIEALRQFDEKRVEELPEKTRNMFYAIMKIADERDELANRCEKAIEHINENANWKEVTEEGYIISGKLLQDDAIDDLLNILNKGDNK